MTELLQKRSFTAKHFEIDPRIGEYGETIPQFLMEAHIGHIHHQDGPLKDGAFQDIDTVPEFNSQTGLYSMRKASYEAEIGLYGDVRFHNVDHSLTFQLPNPNRVEGVPFDGSEWGKQGKALIWKNIIQDGGHQIVEARNGSLAKIFHFDSVPESNVIEFQVDASDGVTLKDADDVKVDISTMAMATRKIQRVALLGTKGLSSVDSVLSIQGSQGLFGTDARTSWIRTPRCWNHRGEATDVELLFFQRDGQLWAQKIIPQDFIDKTFTEKGAWLECDTTTSYYAGSDDGIVYCTKTEAWSTIRTDSAGSNADHGSTVCYMYTSDNGGGNYSNHRLFFPFDTSGLGASAIISTAAFRLNFDGYGTYYYLRITQGTQATPLVSGDYSHFNTTVWLDNYYGNSDATLTAAGIAGINKTGVTYYCARNSYWDAQNNDITGSSPEEVDAKMSENASPPYIKATYTLPVDLFPNGLLSNAVYRM
jgi:hypothetical protein